MTEPFIRQALCRAQKYIAAGSSMAAGNTTVVQPRCSEEFLHLCFIAQRSLSQLREFALCSEFLIDLG